MLADRRPDKVAIVFETEWKDRLEPTACGWHRLLASAGRIRNLESLADFSRGSRERSPIGGLKLPLSDVASMSP